MCNMYSKGDKLKCICVWTILYSIMKSISVLTIPSQHKLHILTCISHTDTRASHTHTHTQTAMNHTHKHTDTHTWTQIHWHIDWRFSHTNTHPLTLTHSHTHIHQQSHTNIHILTPTHRHSCCIRGLFSDSDFRLCNWDGRVGSVLLTPRMYHSSRRYFCMK